MNARPAAPPFRDQERALFEAVAAEDLPGVRAALDLGADPMARNPDDIVGLTSLHAAVSKGNFEIFEITLARSSNPLALDAAGETPLHLAAIGELPEMVAALLRFGGAEIRDEPGFTPLMNAAFAGAPLSLAILLPVSDPKAVDRHGETALHLLGSDTLPDFTEGHLECARMLIPVGDGVFDSTQRDTPTALLFALRAIDYRLSQGEQDAGDRARLLDFFSLLLESRDPCERGDEFNSLIERSAEMSPAALELCLAKAGPLSAHMRRFALKATCYSGRLESLRQLWRMPGDESMDNEAREALRESLRVAFFEAMDHGSFSCADFLLSRTAPDDSLREWARTRRRQLPETWAQEEARELLGVVSSVAGTTETQSATVPVWSPADPRAARPRL
jgi:hypothetical protein